METEWELIQLELKYCERCGGLWMRARGSHQVYCALCALQLKDYPVAREARKVRLPLRKLDTKRPPAAVYSEGGNA